MNLQRKFGRKAKEHLIALIRKTSKDASQIGKLDATDFKNAMNELYFSQLKIIIYNDWAEYQSLFVDRAKFDNFFDIINNSRVDAHSKELDEEDEAILNVAFKFFEKCLADI